MEDEDRPRRAIEQVITGALALAIVLVVLTAWGFARPLWVSP